MRAGYGDKWSRSERDSDPQKRLYYFARRGRTSELRELMNGADCALDVDWASPMMDWTALMVASLEGHADTVAALLELRANPSRAESKLGRAPLSAAAQNGHTDTVRLLLNAKASVNRGDKRGRSALFGAAEYGRVRTAQLLINFGAEVDAPSTRGWTPVMTAAFYNKIDVVKTLVDAGANLSRKDNEGRTVFELVKDEPNKESVAEYLSEVRSKPRNIALRGACAACALM